MDLETLNVLCRAQEIVACNQLKTGHTYIILSADKIRQNNTFFVLITIIKKKTHRCEEPVVFKMWAPRRITVFLITQLGILNRQPLKYGFKVMGEMGPNQEKILRFIKIY